MLLKLLLGGLVELEGNELEATLLEAADDLTDETAGSARALFAPSTPRRRRTHPRWTPSGLDS